MKIYHWGVSSKLWAALGGLLSMMFAVSLWAHFSASHATTVALQTQADFDHRIQLAIEWKGMTAAVGESVLAGSASTDAGLTRMFDERVKAGIARISEVQTEVTKRSQSVADKKLLERIAAIRAEMLIHNKRAREIKLSEDSEALRVFLQQQYLPAITRYVEQLGTFVDLQREQAKVAEDITRTERERLSQRAWVVQGSTLISGLLLAFFLTRSITHPLRKAVSTADSIARGDLTVSSSEIRRDEFGDLLRAVSNMSARLRGLVGAVRESVGSITSASGEIAAGNQNLSSRTEQAASSLGETAASMDQLTGTVWQASDTARKADQLADSAAQAAERGGA